MLDIGYKTSVNEAHFVFDSAVGRENKHFLDNKTYVLDSGIPAKLDNPVSVCVTDHSKTLNRVTKLGLAKSEYLPSVCAEHHSKLLDRAVKLGSHTLTDYEVLTILLGMSADGGRPEDLAYSLLSRFSSLAGVLASSMDQLSAVQGMSSRCGVTLKIVCTAAMRMAKSDILDRPALTSVTQLFPYLYVLLSHEPVENLRVIFLNARNRVIADELLFKGTTDHLPVYPREILKRALELHATAIVVVHNHPSGDPTPSDDDLIMTRYVQAGAKLLSITLHDHLIVGKGKFVSLRDCNLLDS